jgi:hypothetical protein
MMLAFQSASSEYCQQRLSPAGAGTAAAPQPLLLFVPNTDAPKDPAATVDPGICEDVNDNCQSWAAAGACETNKAYMAGDAENHAHCRKSCDVCAVCASGDMACYEGNRRKQGYLVYTEEDELEVNFEDGRPVVRQKHFKGQGACSAAGAACG